MDTSMCNETCTFSIDTGFFFVPRVCREGRGVDDAHLADQFIREIFWLGVRFHLGEGIGRQIVRQLPFSNRLRI